MCICMYVCMIAISSVNSQQIFIKLSFPGSTWNCPGLGWKKSGKIRIPWKKPDFCDFFRPFAYNSQQKVWFSWVLRSSRVTWCKKIREKSGFREKSGLNIFPDFFWNGFFALFCDNKVFLDFQNINFNAHYGPWKIRMRLACTCVRQIRESPRRTTRGMRAKLHIKLTIFLKI